MIVFIYVTAYTMSLYKFKLMLNANLFELTNKIF